MNDIYANAKVSGAGTASALIDGLAVRPTKASTFIPVRLSDGLDGLLIEERILR